MEYVEFCETTQGMVVGDNNMLNAVPSLILAIILLGVAPMLLGNTICGILRLDLKISRERYAIIDRKNHFQKNDQYLLSHGWHLRDKNKYEDSEYTYYSDEYCIKHQNDCLYNYDLNMSLNGKTDDLIRDGNNVGVVHYLVHSVATTPKQVKSINEFISDEVKSHPDLFTGFGTLHPDSDDIEGDFNYLLRDIKHSTSDLFRRLKLVRSCFSAESSTN